MKLVKKFAVAVLFVFVLAVPTLAGDMDTPGKTSVAPPPSNSTTTTYETTETAPVAQSSDSSEVSDKLLYDGIMAVLGLY